jgi:hypothetical protein
MNALVLGAVAFAAVMFSFALVGLLVVRAIPSQPTAKPLGMQEPADEHEHATATMSRVLADIERLAALRDRGALTAKEFSDAKAQLLRTSQQ